MIIHKKNIISSLVILVSLLLSCSNDEIPGIHYEKGNILVEDFNFNKDIFPLNTEWEFYWKKLYTPADFKSEKTKIPDYLKVPEVWNGYIKEDNITGGDGFATYRLVVKNLPSGYYALKIPTMATAYKM
jgi:hypothetical protein